MWEDPANEQGGKWVIQFPRNKTGDDINDLWLYTVSTASFFIKTDKKMFQILATSFIQYFSAIVM